jgi:hypothetical protein
MLFKLKSFLFGMSQRGGPLQELPEGSKFIRGLTSSLGTSPTR